MPRSAPLRQLSAQPHPLDEFFEAPDEADPDGMARYAGRAWRTDELRNKVRSAPAPSRFCTTISLRIHYPRLLRHRL